MSELKEEIEKCLECVYVCTREWSSWGVGTMTQDDFHPVNEDDNIVEDILKAVSPAKDAEVVESSNMCDYCKNFGDDCEKCASLAISGYFRGRRLTDSKEGEA